jgi:hypothetical protein
MIWFGSSAGVALSNMFPEAKSVGRWLAQGWHVTLAYVVGFIAIMTVMGWHPTDKRGHALAEAPPVAEGSHCAISRCEVALRGTETGE